MYHIIYILLEAVVSLNSQTSKISTVCPGNVYIQESFHTVACKKHVTYILYYIHEAPKATGIDCVL